MTAGAPRPRPATREPILWWVLVILHLLPIWWFRYFPSQDGPSHLETVGLVIRLLGPDPGLAGQYFELNQYVLPNLLCQAILAVVMLILPALWAEKVFLSLMLVSFAASTRWTLGALGGNGRQWALLSLPFFYTWTLHMGFYNFVLGISLFFWTWGYWLRNRQDLGAAKTVRLGLLAMALYLCHPVALVMGCLAVGVMAVWEVLLDRAAPLGRKIGRLARPAAALAPAVLLLAAFVMQQGAAPREFLPWGYIVKSLASLGFLVSFARGEHWLYGLLAAGLWGMALLVLGRRWSARGKGLVFSDGLPILALVGLAIAVTAPDNLSGGGYLTDRVCLFPYFFLLAWLAAQDWPARALGWLRVSAVALSLSLLALHAAKYHELNIYLDDYLSATERIEDHKTILPISLGRVRDPQGRPVSLRVNPFIHAAAYVAAQRPVVDLGHYQAIVDHFPLVYRPSVNPYRHIGILAKEPPLVDFATFGRRTGGSVDYVLLWARDSAGGDPQAVARIQAQLAAGYDLIFTSPATGLLRLYRSQDQRSR